MEAGIRLLSRSVEQTQRIGGKIGHGLAGGDLVALTGCLGAGKTLLTKGIATGLGVEDADDVTSPSYKLVNIYHGRVDVFHVDAYRLDPAGAGDLVIDEARSGGSVVIVEWADRLGDLLGDPTIEIAIKVTGAQMRTIEISKLNVNVEDSLKNWSSES